MNRNENNALSSTRTYLLTFFFLIVLLVLAPSITPKNLFANPLAFNFYIGLLIINSMILGLVISFYLQMFTSLDSSSEFQSFDEIEAEMKTMQALSVKDLLYDSDKTNKFFRIINNQYLDFYRNLVDIWKLFLKIDFTEDTRVIAQKSQAICGAILPVKRVGFLLIDSGAGEKKNQLPVYSSFENKEVFEYHFDFEKSKEFFASEIDLEALSQFSPKSGQKIISTILKNKGGENHLCLPLETHEETFGLTLFEKDGKEPFTEKEKIYLEFFSRQTAFIFGNSHNYQKSLFAKSIQGELNRASGIQEKYSDLVSKGVTPGLEWAIFHELANTIGGDYLNGHFFSDSHFIIFYADVSGKGVPAAIYKASLHTAFQIVLRSLTDAGSYDSYVFLEKLNEAMQELKIPEMYSVGCLVEVFLETRTLKLLSFGAESPILVKNGEEEGKFIKLAGQPLGLFDSDKESFDQSEVTLKAGDILLFYTDGFNDAQNRKNPQNRLGREALLAKTLTMKKECPTPLNADKIVTLFQSYISEYEGPMRGDDQTLIALVGNRKK